MSDFDFPELATGVADSVEPPAYQGLVERARSRRRRRAAGTATAAACAVLVVASAAFVTRQAESADPIDTPTPTHKVTSTGPLSAEDVVGQGTLRDVASGPSDTMTLWQHCRKGNYGGCQSAWRIDGSSSPAALLPKGQWNATATADKFVLTNDQGVGGFIVAPDGSTTPLQDGEPSAITSDTALVFSTGRSPQYIVVDAARAAQWPLTVPDGVTGWASAKLDADGGVWALAYVDGHPQQVDVWHSADGGSTWSHEHALTVGAPTMPGYLATADHHVAALGSYDGATVAPVGDLAVTSDDGATWHDLAKDDVPFEFIDSMAATKDGTLYVVGGAMQGGGPMRLYRTTDDTWTEFTEVELPNGEQIEGLEDTYSGVLGHTGTMEGPGLVSLDDGGVHPWPNPLR